jgi:acetyltransferase-like isoleucine patch superfamily enzyme
MGDFIKGRHSYGEIDVIFRGKVTVGAFCSIASGVVAVMEGHRVDWVSTYPFTGRHFCRGWGSVPEYPTVTNGDIEIGNDVWIGQDVMLLSGVKIGNGAVIGARSLVTSDVAPYEIVGGTPARFIRNRFSIEQIFNLQKIAWWNWPDEKIKENLSNIMNSDIEKFIELHL